MESESIRSNKGCHVIGCCTSGTWLITSAAERASTSRAHPDAHVHRSMIEFVIWHCVAATGLTASANSVASLSPYQIEIQYIKKIYSIAENRTIVKHSCRISDDRKRMDRIGNSWVGCFFIGLIPLSKYISMDTWCTLRIQSIAGTATMYVIPSWLWNGFGFFARQATYPHHWILLVTHLHSYQMYRW